MSHIFGVLLKLNLLLNMLPIINILDLEVTTNQTTEAVVRRCFVKQVFLEILRSSQAQACNFIKKESLAQMFSCEFCEISKNTFFYRTPPVAASKTRTKELCFGFLCKVLTFSLTLSQQIMQIYVFQMQFGFRKF